MLYIAVGLVGLFNQHAYALADQYELKTAVATLSINQYGNIRIANNKSGKIHLSGSLNEIWKILLKNCETGKEFEIGPNKELELKEIDGVLYFGNSKFYLEESSLPLRVEFNISVKDDAFCFSGLISSDSKEWLIKELSYPIIPEIKYSEQNTNIYWPYRLGERFENPQEFGSRTFEYPGSFGSMAWFSINSSGSGIYFGNHDNKMGIKKVTLSYSDNTKLFKSDVCFPINNFEYTVPNTVIQIYEGSWHNASRIYRKWYDKNFSTASTSQWVNNNTGFMLVILKQQNGNVMWKYSDIDQLCDIAEKRNIKLIGLWGRGVGGHDRLYPNYMPDNLLGGEEEMKKAIRRAQERGFKVIVYSNGTIMDTSTDFYVYNGIQTISLDEEKRPIIATYLKHSNATPVVQALACHGSSLWRKTILNLALDAQSLGVDAFYIDEVGFRNPVMCHSEIHDHFLPQDADTKYRLKMMRDIRNTMKDIDPDFSILTEGSVDQLLSDVDIFHNGGPSSKDPYTFPELFRYTFPESRVIQLNPSPALTRFDANFDSVYGFIHEIMCRYEPDVEYLKYGIIPTSESYSNHHINDPPIISTMNQASAEEVASYVYDLIQFENNNSMLLRNGKFIDDEGIEVKGEDILAKGYLNGENMGVMVWNKNLTAKRDFTISVPGYKLIKASEPRNPEVVASATLSANSVRILIYKKQ